MIGNVKNCVVFYVILHKLHYLEYKFGRSIEKDHTRKTAQKWRTEWKI